MRDGPIDPDGAAHHQNETAPVEDEPLSDWPIGRVIRFQCAKERQCALADSVLVIILATTDHLAANRQTDAPMRTQIDGSRVVIKVRILLAEPPLPGNQNFERAGHASMLGLTTGDVRGVAEGLPTPRATP